MIGRHAYGDQYSSSGFTIDQAGSVDLVFTPAALQSSSSSGEADVSRRTKRIRIADLDGPGVALGMFNTDHSITGFAHSCFQYALSRKWPLYFSSKNTILKQYDGRFKDLFQQIYER